MVWAGDPYAQRIEFSTGAATGAVSYKLLDNDNNVLIDTQLPVDANAISLSWVIPGDQNTCALPLFESRTITWSYPTADGLVTGRKVYQVRRALPFAVCEEGVRSKLGLEPHELRDGQIDLVTAYSDLKAVLAIDAYANTGDRNALLVIHAIEATAALAVLPILQLRVAQKESSGTNQYERYTDVDWQMLQAHLQSYVDAARAAIDDTFDGTGGNITSFLKITPSPDVITGA